MPNPTSPVPDENESDIFEADPFFNPEIPPEPPVPSEPVMTAQAEPAMEPEPVTAPIPIPPPPAPEPPALRNDALTADSDAEKAVEQAMRDLHRMKARLAALGSELTAVREQSARESQLRKAEASRHAMLEQEWNRKSGELKSLANDRDEALLEGTPGRSSLPVVLGAVVTGLLAVGAALFIGRAWGLHDSGAFYGTPTDDTEVVPPLSKTDRLLEGRAPSRPFLPEPNPAKEVTPPPTPPIAAKPTPPMAAKPTPPIVAKPVVAKRHAPVWPALSGEGFKTSQSGNTLTLKFGYGVFARGTELSDTARQDLKRIAEALKPTISRFRLEVEGHTDTTPVSAGRIHASNRELGLARAKAVTDYLTHPCGLPAASLSSTSAGDANPPYPNTTPGGQRRNRTVVLKLSPVPGG